MPCMNCTSAGEAGGSVALVVGGRVRVGFPGAPGWTTTGVAGSACCAQRPEEKALASLLADTSTAEHAATLSTTRISQVHLTYRGLMCRKYLTIVGLPYHIQGKLHIRLRPILLAIGSKAPPDHSIISDARNPSRRHGKGVRKPISARNPQRTLDEYIRFDISWSL